MHTDLDDTRKDAIALFDFRARNEKELSLKKGDTIQLHARVSSEWWRGSSSGQMGLIPHSYIAVQSRWHIGYVLFSHTNIVSIHILYLVFFQSVFVYLCTVEKTSCIQMMVIFISHYCH